jgi:hypothetical protein
MLRRVEEQPADADSYIQTPYGIAAVRADEVPAADGDEGLFGSPRATEPVSHRMHIQSFHHIKCLWWHAHRSSHLPFLHLRQQACML